MSWDTNNNGGNNDSWGASNADGGAKSWDSNAQPWDSNAQSWDSNAQPVDSGNTGNTGGDGSAAWDSGNTGGDGGFNQGGDSYNSGGGYGGGGDGGGRSHAPREGDWDCSSCGVSNFARRTECFKCGTAGGNGGGEGGAPARPRGEISAEVMAHRDYKWASNRVRYEYNENAVDEHGMGRRDEELENELFEANSADQQTTLDFSKYERIPVRVERGSAPPPIKKFDEADLNPVMKENVRLARYVNPTPVQTYSIPIVTAGKDLMACAQTGSGKTAAFLIPSLSALFTSAKELQKPRPAPYEYRTYKAEPLILIIAPTRELCSQIFDECRRFTYRSCLRPCAVYGGADSIGQIRQLERGCDVLTAAPGRLMDFIERGKIGLNRVKYLILDEADRMLDMGFEAIIRQLVEKKGMPTDRQTLMFSATFPRAIRALARDFLKPDYLFLKVGRVGGTSDSITQKVMYVEEDEKREALRTLLNSQPPSRTLIFVETKRSADSLDQYLYERSFPSTSIHGDRTQMEREDALLAFKSGQCPILVATAVAARGIDIRNVMHVINYDMPNDMDEYIHRIGRTARVGKSGLATSFYNDRSEGIAPELTKLLKECKQQIPDFLTSYVTDDITFDEDLDDQGVEAPHYANQEYVPMERNVPGAPQGFNNASGTGAADGAWNAGENSTPGWENSGDGGYGGGGGGHAPREGDWNCSSCSASNFARRTECFKCGTAGGNGGGGGGGGGREGEWPCPDCGINNFPRRTECFKCNAARPEGMGDQSARGPRPRRDGDWDCSGCSAVNYAFRDTCFKCQASKDGAAGGGYGDNSYGDSSYGQSTFDSSAAGGSSEWNPSASAASGGWGSSEPAAPAAAPATGGWGSSEPAAPAATPAAGGWGSSEPAAPAATPAAGGWGSSEPAAPAATPAAGGWGSSEPAAPAAAPATGGWGSSEPAAPAATPAAGGWGEPAAPQQSSPAPASNGWGAPAAASPAPPAQTPPPQQQQQSPAPAAGGWGEPAKPASPAVTAPASGGWGDAPANPPAPGGWGDAPAAANGAGWN